MEIEIPNNISFYLVGTNSSAFKLILLMTLLIFIQYIHIKYLKYLS